MKSFPRQTFLRLGNAATNSEAVVDPYEPPMPPSATMDQASKFAESLARGEPNRKKIALTVAEDKVREMV